MSPCGCVDRREFTSWLGWCVAATLVGASGQHMPTPPNLVILLADDLGYGDLGCYGGTEIRTPHLDRLAAEGVRFTDAYANAPVCSPTRVALLTGRYQQRVGYEAEDYMGGGCPGLDPAEHPTLAMDLKQAGYATACYGKWNVGGEANITPNDHGFDHWVGIQHNLDYFTHRQFDHAAKRYSGDIGLFEDGRRVRKEGYMTDVLGDLSVDWIRARAQDRRPFLLYVPWQAPHAPMQAPDDDPENPPPRTTAPENRPYYIKIVERLDRQVGRIMTALREAGLDRNTLVFFASDNGGHRCACNAPLKGGKQDLDEGGIRVPMMARWPGVFPAGSVTSQPTLTLDITATVCAAAGVAPVGGRELDGINLLPILTEEEPVVADRPLYWRRMITDCRRWTTRLRARAIRVGRWKFIHDAIRNRQALYDLADDLGETRNLLHTHPETAAELRARLEHWEAAVTPGLQPEFTVIAAGVGPGEDRPIGLSGRVRRAAPGVIDVDADGELVSVDVPRGAPVRLVEQLRSPDPQAGAYVAVTGDIDGDTIKAQRITMTGTGQRGAASVSGRQARGTLQPVDGGWRLQVKDRQLRVVCDERTQYFRFTLLELAGLAPGVKVLVNYRRRGSRAVADGIFVYPEQE